MKAYSLDLRQRILHTSEQGKPCVQIAALFQVSLSTVKRYLRQQRQSGTLTVKPIPGRPAKYGAALDAGLPTQVAAHPDATLEYHCQLWEQTSGQRVSTATMSRAIARLDWTRKKRHWQPLSGANRRGRPGATSPRT